jgi:DHA1 family tetracycline resistance protein-like MFS transporter
VFIFATVLFDTLGFGIIIPVLPGLVVSFVRGDPARGAEIFGLFGTTWALMQFLFAPLLGALSDRYGRRPVLILSAFGLGIDYIIMALAPNLTWLFIGRVVSGIRDWPTLPILGRSSTLARKRRLRTDCVA